MSYDVIIIGAGASGLFAAGKIASKGLSVCLLEKKTRPAIKLSITGKGRCNITNSADVKEFVENFGKNGKFLYSAFSKFFNIDTISFFEQLLPPRCAMPWISLVVTLNPAASAADAMMPAANRMPCPPTPVSKMLLIMFDGAPSGAAASPI